MGKESLTAIILGSSLLSLVSAGAFGTFGAIVQYLYLVVKTDELYSSWGLLSYSIMGFFVGIVANETTLMFLDETYPGIVLVSGFIFMKVLDFLDGSKLADLIGFLIKR